MPGLETAFYIVGIVFMGIMLVLITILVIAVGRIHTKINKIHRLVDQKINSVGSALERGSDLAEAVLKTGKSFLNKFK